MLGLHDHPFWREIQIQQSHGDTGDLNTSYDFLYPANDVEKRPVEKADQLSTEQQVYMQWIENILKIDRKTSKDPRFYCGSAT